MGTSKRSKKFSGKVAALVRKRKQVAPIKKARFEREMRRKNRPQEDGEADQPTQRHTSASSSPYHDKKRTAVAAASSHAPSAKRVSVAARAPSSSSSAAAAAAASSSSASGDGVTASESREHKEQLEAMQRDDPEFYEFLKQHDRELLDFEGADEDANEDDDEEDEAEEEDELALDDAEDGKEQLQLQQQKKKQRRTLDMAQLVAWEDTLNKSPDMRPLRALVVAFRCAAHIGDSENVMGSSLSDASGAEKRAMQREQQEFLRRYPFDIVDSAVFNRLMLYCLRNVHLLLDRALARSSTDANAPLPAKCQRWPRLALIARSYLYSLQHFLHQLSHETMIDLLLRQVQAFAPYYACIPKLASRMLKALVHLWSTSEHAVRVSAYVCIRSLALRIPFPFVERCMKQLYMAYVRVSKFVTTSSLAEIQFMANCVCDMYTLDPPAAYQHAFVYVRQLVIHLRNATHNKTKDTINSVYNWQFVNSLGVWAQLLATPAVLRELQPLVYPLIQLIFSTIKLVPTPKYYPLRFHCVRMLQRIAEAHGVFVPAAPLLLEVFDSPLITSPIGKKPGALRPSELLLVVKASKADLVSKVFRERVFETSYLLLAEHLAQYASWISFPELALPSVSGLRRAGKAIAAPYFSKQVAVLYKKLEEQAALIERARANVEFAPADVAAVAAFASKQSATSDGKRSPLVAFASGLQQAEKSRVDQLHSQWASERVRFSSDAGSGAASKPKLQPAKKAKADEDEDSGSGSESESDSDSDEDESEGDESGDDDDDVESNGESSGDDGEGESDDESGDEVGSDVPSSSDEEAPKRKPRQQQQQQAKSRGPAPNERGRELIRRLEAASADRVADFVLSDED